ncbi:MAG: polyprenyl synthetase family protein [Phycisphaerales bacterium]|nr:polyprenyl synthetase family protein [Phycisphaerales bacterium]
MPSVLDIPSELESTQGILEQALVRVEQRFSEQLSSDLPPVARLCRHVDSYRGKMVRPALVLLSGMAAAAGRGDADAQTGQVSDGHVSIAAVCEMIHMATLVHDDVLDEADTRRKGATINRLHGNEAAVILGDYLFSAAFHLCSSLDSQASALLIGSTGMALCAGELLQLHHRENFSLDEQTYFQIVERKTASLIGAACKLGAIHSGAGEATAERFHEFGLSLGVAFQIQDDLLDLTGAEDRVGKPLRRDVELGKLTLPLIHHLRSAPAPMRGETLARLEAVSQAAYHVDHDDATADSLYQALRLTHSIAYARGVATDLVERAKASLVSVPDSPARRYLFLMADAVIDRDA